MANEQRFIDANAYAESWSQIPDEYESYTARQVIEDIISFPTVDAVEVVHGRWIPIEVSDELYKCSSCSEWQFVPEEKFAYCPHCGAKMDGGNEAYSKQPAEKKKEL